MGKCRFITWLIIVTAITATSQKELPREYIPAEDLISLNGNLEITNAFDMLSEYAIRLSGKPLYDPTRQAGAIGVEINTLPWEKALQAILSRRGLWYAEREHFIQIMIPEEKAVAEDKKIAGDINFNLGNREIKIETIFFEGNRKALAEMGIDWTSFYQGKVNVSSEQFAAFDVTEQFFSTAVTIPKSLFNVDVRALLKAFDSRNMGKVLAQPQVMVSEGNEGKIQVGEDFSIKTRDFAGNIIDKFFSTGTILQVTPYIILDPEKGPVIFLKAHVERSQAYPDAVSTIIKKSEANSYVQLYDGEETLIAGLYSTENANVRKGVPILMNLPWWFFGLRYLFSYEHKEEQQKELIIIIKASLLPDVFTRKDRPDGIKSKSEGVQDKADRYLREAFQNSKPAEKSVAVEKKLASALTEQADVDVNERPVLEREKLASSTKDNSNGTLRLPESDTSNMPVTPANNTARSISASGISSKSLITKPSNRELGSTQAYFPEFKAVESGRDESGSADIKNIYRGVIKNVQNNLVLIEWSNGFDPSQIAQEYLTVFRRQADRKDYHKVAQVRIVRNQDFRTIARTAVENGNRIPIQPGDQVVIKL